MGNEAELNRPSAHPLEMAQLLLDLFDSVYEERVIYRSTRAVLLDLVPDMTVQYSLFEEPRISGSCMKPLTCEPEIRQVPLHLGIAHLIDQFGKGRRGETTEREKARFMGETKRKHLRFPIIHVKTK